VEKGEDLEAKCVVCRIDRQGCKTSVVAGAAAVSGPSSSPAVLRSKPVAKPLAFGTPSLLAVPSVVAPPMAMSTSLPSPLTAGPGPMDEDAPTGPSKKHSYDALAVARPSSSKQQKTSGTSGRSRQGTSVASSSSSRFRVDAPVSGPSSPLVPMTSLEVDDPVLLHLDAIESAVRRGDMGMALRRIDEVRRMYVGRKGKGA